MRLLTRHLVFTTRWSSERRRPSIVRHTYPKPEFIIGVSFFGWAIVKRSWWNTWTDNGRLAA